MLEDVAYWTAFETGITNGEVNTEIDVDNMGVGWYSVSGWFEGSEADCTSAITAIEPSGYTLLTGKTARNDYTNKTTFAYKYILNAEGIVSSRETLTVKYQIYEFVHKRVLNGAVPIKQYTSKGTYRYTQIGQLVHKDVYQANPAYNWASSGLISEVVTRMAPEYQVAAGDFVYGINYAYEFEFATNQGWSS